MSWQALGWAWSQRLEDPESKLLLVALADKANELGVCWPGQQQLMNDCAVSRSTLHRRLRLLEEQGYLRTVRQRRAGGQLGGNTYELQLQHHVPTVAHGEDDHVAPVAHGHVPALAHEEPSTTEPSKAVGATPQRGAATAGATATAGSSNGGTTRSPSRKQDLLWDVFDELLGKVGNDVERGKRNRALKAVRQSLATDGIQDAQLQAAALRMRVQRALALWGKRGITVTELAVAGNWRLLGDTSQGATERAGGLSAQEVYAMTRGLA